MAIKFLSGLNLSGITTGSLLKLDSNGDIVAAVAGTDYATSSSAVWSTSGSNPTTAYYTGRVRVGTYQASVEASAKLHVFDYQTTDPKLLIEDGNTGDASMQFKISTQSYVMGIDNSDSDKFKLSASTAFGTSDVLTISSGNVGIGTTSPGENLTVIGNNAVFKAASVTADTGLPTKRLAEFAGIYNSGSNGHQMFISSTAGTGSWEINQTKTWGGIMTFGVSSNGTEITRHLSINSSGNVGIGTTSPNRPLTIATNTTDVIGALKIWNAGTGDASMFFTVNASGTVWQMGIDNSDSDKFKIGNDNSNADVGVGTKLTIDTSGNVGIGTTSPLVGLDVRGTAIITNSAGNNYNENLRLPQATSGYAAIALGGSVAASGTSAAQWTILKYPTNNDFAIRNNNSDKLYITTSGTVKLLAYGAGLLKTNASGEVSLDTNTYLTTSSASSTYLPLTGGTVANGNTAIPLTISRTSATSQQVGIRFLATDGESEPTDMYFGAGTDAEPYWATTANLSVGSMIWHEGNDGAGSGLDADTLDGYHASSFLTAEADTLSSVTGRGASTATALTLSATAPLNMTAGSNTGTYNKTVYYYNQNNTSGSASNGVFIERGRITDSASAEVRNFVIGSRGGQIQWRVNGTGSTEQSGDLVLSNSASPTIYLTSNNATTGKNWTIKSRNDGYFLIGRHNIANDMYFDPSGNANFAGALSVSGTTHLGGSANAYTRFGTYGVLLSTDTHILHNMYYNNAWYQIDNTKASSNIYMGSSSDNTIKFGYAGAGSTTWGYKHTFYNDGDYTAAKDVTVGAILYTATVKTTNAATVIDNSGIQPDQGTVEDIVKFKWSGTQVASVDTGGYVNATGFKTSGTTGFLKSDGSVDTSSYISSIPSEYVTDTELTTALGSYLTTSSFNSAVAFVLNGTDVTMGDDVTLGSAAFSATTDFVAVTGDTMTGSLTIDTGTNGSTTQAYTAFDRLIFNNQYSDVARGANKIVLYDDGSSWMGGFGIHDDTVAYYTGGTHKWYKVSANSTYTERMTLDASGNLSIDGSLSVGGATFVDANRRNIYLDSFDASGGAGIFFRDGFTYNASITAEDHNGSSADGICISGYDGVSFSTGANTRQERMRVATNGNVGIGTTSPSSNLHVNSAGGSGVTTQIKVTQADDGAGHAGADAILQSSGWGEAYLKLGGHHISAAGGQFNVQSSSALNFKVNNGTSRMFIAAAGNVGVNTTSPSYTLDVNGSTRISGILRTTDPVFVNNRSGLSVAHWSASGNTTGAIRITLPGSHTGNWSMIVLRITAYEYSGNRHCVYYVSGHDWTSGWYNFNVTKIGKSDKDIKVGYDSTANKDYVVIGGTSSSWSYGHVTVDVVAHPGFYTGNMDITSGWDIRQTTDLSGITLQTTNNDQVWDSGNDGSGSGLDADTVDGIQASSFLRSDADDSFSGNLTSASTGWIKFYHTNQTDSNDGKIGSGVFASGLNIVGTQTTAGTGRQVRVWGSLIDSSGNEYATQSYVSTAIANLVDQAPQALDTLSELAAALGDDAAFSTTVSTALGNRLRIDTNAQNLTATEKSNAYTNLDLANNFLPLSGVVLTVNGTDYSPGDELGAADLLAKIKTVDGSTSGLDADLLDGNHASAFASSGFLTNTGGAKIEVQNATDGGTSNGIYMWQTSDPNWVIYMGQAGTSRSAAGGTAASGIDGRTSHAIRFRVNNSASQIGFLWENSSEDALMQLTGDTGHLYTKGRIYTSDQTTNYVDSTRISNWQTAYGWGNHSTQGYLTSTFGGDVTAQNINPAADTTYDLGRDGGRWRVVWCETLDSAGIHEANLANKKTGLYATGTVLVWKDGQAIPSTSFADYMKIGIAVYGNSSPLVHGAEPVLCTGQVEEGDYLVTSTETGHAMALTRQEVRERNLMDCVIGKALESGDGKSHLIKTWLTI